MPAASAILMVRPAAFGFNEETALNNYFQSASSTDAATLQQKALQEFDNMVATLRSHNIEVLVIDDSPLPPKPSAIFPNNWLSTSTDGKLCVFPMCAPNRRDEKRDEIIKQLTADYIVKEFQDWSEYEADGRYLEGTGSMIIDHDHQMIYAAISERTNIAVLEKFASANGYQAIAFIATDAQGRPIYHTNVMMALGQNFCVLCEEAIEEEWELIAVRQLLETTGHSIVPICRVQMNVFAGNMLEVKNKAGENILIMSEAAFQSLSEAQKTQLEKFSNLLPIGVPTIEATEGGSVRCMMAEIFLERRE